MAALEKIEVRIADAKIADIRSRVAAAHMPIEPDLPPWELGVPLSFMKRAKDYFLDAYDWSQREQSLNLLPNFRAEIEGTRVHFIHARSEHSEAIPLLLLHGWPGSVIEFADLVNPLILGNPAVPESAGFHVVVPSLPGFGFSDAPAGPLGPRVVARMMHKLMTEVLGYKRYAVQGGDWGSMIAGWLGYDYPEACRAVHWTMMGLSPGGDQPGFTKAPIAAPETDAERQWAARLAHAGMEFGYASIQSTKPQTLGYAMSDSPFGVMAWILEKFHGWTDTRGAAPDELISFNTLLDNVMLYVGTDKFVSASWMYRSLVTEGNALPPGQKISVPLGMIALPHDVLPAPPRSYVEKCANVVRWTEVDRGGHFLSLEQPDVWLADVRAFFKDHDLLFQGAGREFT